MKKRKNQVQITIELDFYNIYSNKILFLSINNLIKYKIFELSYYFENMERKKKIPTTIQFTNNRTHDIILIYLL